MSYTYPCKTHLLGIFNEQGEPTANLVTNVPVEFEKSSIEVQDFMKITDHFRRVHETNKHQKIERSQHVTGWIWKTL